MIGRLDSHRYLRQITFGQPGRYLGELRAKRWVRVEPLVRAQIEIRADVYQTLDLCHSRDGLNALHIAIEASEILW